MSIKILYYPDKRLRKIAKYVYNINNSTRSLIKDMFDFMYFKDGIGLAATQVNIHKQIVVIDISEKKNKPLVLINPKILKKNGYCSINEGCLSIPDKNGFVIRSKRILVKALNYYSDKIYVAADNLLSICIQHELDHLKGRLFIDNFYHFNILKYKKNN